MKKQIIIEKVKVINHDKFIDLIIYTLKVVLVLSMFLLIFSGIAQTILTGEDGVLIILSVLLILIFYYFYEASAEETTEQIEKEVWIK